MGGERGQTPVIVRPERAADDVAVDAVVTAAFATVAYSAHDEARLVARLRASEAYVPDLALVAEAAGAVVGHLLLTRVTITGGALSVAALALGPLSVVPAWQRQGIGSALIAAAHARACGMGFAAIVVLGDGGYYRRFGYRRLSGFGLTMPFDAPDAHCRILPLDSDALPESGRVVYPDAWMG